MNVLIHNGISPRHGRDDLSLHNPNQREQSQTTCKVQVYLYCRAVNFLLGLVFSSLNDGQRVKCAIYMGESHQFENEFPLILCPNES